ncbi:hypothetical protein Ate01nite_25100 [Actinoplanes teichomyceticus]|nr:hypothetical protein Ate01nite_25100 [Actinoplanes teichomyceticus]
MLFRPISGRRLVSRAEFTFTPIDPRAYKMCEKTTRRAPPNATIGEVPFGRGFIEALDSFPGRHRDEVAADQAIGHDRVVDEEVAGTLRRT